VRKYRRKGRLEAASELQDDIERRQEYDVRAVTRLNEVFYQAFTKQVRWAVVCVCVCGSIDRAAPILPS